MALGDATNAASTRSAPASAMKLASLRERYDDDAKRRHRTTMTDDDDDGRATRRPIPTERMEWNERDENTTGVG